MNASLMGTIDVAAEIVARYVVGVDDLGGAVTSLA
jgi:hypothetical protein